MPEIPAFNAPRLRPAVFLDRDGNDERGRGLSVRPVASHPVPVDRGRRAPAQSGGLRGGRRDEPGRHRAPDDSTRVHPRTARRSWPRTSRAAARAWTGGITARIIPRRSSRSCGSTVDAGSRSRGCCSMPRATCTSIRRGRGSSATSGATSRWANESARAPILVRTGWGRLEEGARPEGQAVDAVCDNLAEAVSTLLAIDGRSQGYSVTAMAMDSSRAADDRPPPRARLRCARAAASWCLGTSSPMSSSRAASLACRAKRRCSFSSTTRPKSCRGRGQRRQQRRGAGRRRHAGWPRGAGRSRPPRGGLVSVAREHAIARAPGRLPHAREDAHPRRRRALGEAAGRAHRPAHARADHRVVARGLDRRGLARVAAGRCRARLRLRLRAAVARRRGEPRPTSCAPPAAECPCSWIRATTCCAIAA